MQRSESSRSGGRARRRKRAISGADVATSAQLDAWHDAGTRLTGHLDLGRARRPGRETQRVNVDFPLELLKAIDQEARRVGVTRQAFIKLRLADSLPL